jgi:hypothetical protein
LALEIQKRDKLYRQQDLGLSLTKRLQNYTFWALKKANIFFWGWLASFFKALELFRVFEKLSLGLKVKVTLARAPLKAQ